MVHKLAHNALLPVSISPIAPSSGRAIPLFGCRVPAGFPSPADDYFDKSLDLNELVIRHPAATFFVRVEGESMIGAGIHSGDTLVVDRALKPQGHQVVVAVLDGQFTVKRIDTSKGRLLLLSDNPAMAPLEVSDEAHFEIWGVVTYVIHAVK